MAVPLICAPCRLRSIWLAAAFAVLLCSAANISIQLEDGAFRVAGWTATREPSEGWASVFSVHTGSVDTPAMLGTYTVSDGVLEFHPRFPITAGVHYRAVFKTP